jgi:hypothetical protein
MITDPGRLPRPPDAGGLEGVSVNDLAGSAGAAFEAIYKDAGWRKEATVRFTGGLLESKTGKDLPNEPTGYEPG